MSGLCPVPMLGILWLPIQSTGRVRGWRSWSQKSQKAGQLSTCLSEPKGNITKKSELQILPFSLTQSTSTKAIWKCICYVMQLHILLQLHAHQSRVYEYVHWSYVTCSYIFHVTEVVSFQLCYRQLLYTNCSANALMVVWSGLCVTGVLAFFIQ